MLMLDTQWPDAAMGAAVGEQQREPRWSLERARLELKRCSKNVLRSHLS